MSPGRARWVAFSTPRDYAQAAASENAIKTLTKDWAHFARWCRMKGAEPLPPSPEMTGHYLADLAAGSGPSPALAVSTIDRRLSGLAWTYAQRGLTLDRKNRHIATVLAGIIRRHARPPVQKTVILAEYILAMVATLPLALRGLRDRAFLLIGYAGGLRRSEIVTLDVGKDDTPDSDGWVEILKKSALLTLNANSGRREVEIGRSSKEQGCPVHALQRWLHFARIDFCPVFVATSRDGNNALETRLNDKHFAFDQTHRSGRRHPGRPAGGEPFGAVFRSLAARQSREFSRGRRALCPETAWPHFGRDDTSLPAPPRSVPGEPDQIRPPIAFSPQAVV
ncbi:Tyrosine recombinase XerC (plasmid) [Roseivivax sp. THAF40]|nr:Tyrosine recombinase XerC [Roseivivax sp. THAF40]QFT65067.1 Tyrosine recombinase XerC [Roseivivax sp. THAF30]